MFNYVEGMRKYYLLSIKRLLELDVKMMELLMLMLINLLNSYMYFAFKRSMKLIIHVHTIVLLRTARKLKRSWTSKKYLQILIVLQTELSTILMNKLSSAVSLKMQPEFLHRRKGRDK